MEQRIRGAAFQALKRALKARGMTYEDLATRLGVSTPTVKRLFSDQDCKFARLLEICDALEISAAALLESAARREAPAATLPAQVERALADAPSLFHVYILLREPFTGEQIAESLRIEPEDVFLYARDLERLGLAEIGADGHIAARPDGPVAFAAGGPLWRQIKRINAAFLDKIVEAARPGATRSEAGGEAAAPGTASYFCSRSRRMSPETAAEIRRDLEAVAQKAERLAQQDQLLYGSKALTTLKLVFLWGPAEFESLLAVAPHPRNKASVEI